MRLAGAIGAGERLRRRHLRRTAHGKQWVESRAKKEEDDARGWLLISGRLECGWARSSERLFESMSTVWVGAGDGNGACVAIVIVPRSWAVYSFAEWGR